LNERSYYFDMYNPVEEHVTDEALVKSIVNGNQAAFRLLVLRNEKLVIHIVCRMVKLKQDQEDICQEVFLKVYDKLAGFRFGSKLSTWIGSIAFNTCVNFLSKTKIALTDIEEPFAEVNTAPAPDELLINKERNRLLWQYVDELPPVQQTVLSLFHRQEISLDEIAAMMNMPLGTVKSHLHRARQAIRMKLSV
jgi:RNA polymerase sigma factor (sigma-70 family)